MSPVTGGRSYWMESVPPTDLPVLDGDLDAAACVVGGGMTGLLCAYELAQAGVDVVVLEAGRIAASVTGYTTAKLTSQHDLRYRRLTDQLGPDAARTYGRVNQEALARIIAIADEVGAAGVEPRDAYVYAVHPDRVPELQAEAKAAADAGLPATFTTQVPLPFDVAGAVRFADQAQIHPRALLVAVADALRGRGVRILESTEAKGVERDGARWAVTCAGGTVRADAVVLAALTPAAGVGDDLWQYLYCHQGFAVALPLRAAGPNGVFISHERPMRSIRTIADGQRRLLEVGGASYAARPSSGDTPYDDLERWAREHFDVGPTEYRWTTQDYSTSDGVPLIGAVEDGLYLAAGFGGWGMTTAGVAAAAIRDHITGRAADEGRDRLLDPGRTLAPVDDALISAHTSSGTDRPAKQVVADLAPAEAAVVRHDGRQLAVHRRPDGTLDVVSAICTHAGCVVLWDVDTAGWSCPCHGSRFAPDGAVTRGPAEDPLADGRGLLGAPGL